MAAKTTKDKKDTAKRVRCAGCVHFQRDTEGISHNAYTGEFFMGICTEGLHPHSPIKQFADKLHACEVYDDETAKTN